MPYAFIAPGLTNVFDTWDEVEAIYKMYAYPKFRKFRTRDEAWEFIRKNSYSTVFPNVSKYGDKLEDIYITVEYFIRSDGCYYNIKGHGIKYLEFGNKQDDVLIDNRIDHIKVCIPTLMLNNDAIPSHLMAISAILNFIGEFIDVEIVVPNHSIFYSLTIYEGNNITLNRYLQKFKSRLANICVTMKSFYKRR